MSSLRSAWLNVAGRRRLPVVRQTSVTECGLACIAMIASFYGAGVDLDALRRRHRSSLRGASLDALVRICRREGFATRAVRCEADELDKLHLPCILHWRFSHFVVLRRTRRGRVVLHDPACGVVDVSVPELSEAFTGVALEVRPTGDFTRSVVPSPLRLVDLVPRGRVLARGFTAGLLLALVAEMLAVVSPWYLQFVIDDVIGRGDVGLLRTLAVAFSALLVFQAGAIVMRRLVFQYLAHFAIFDMAARVFARLMSLPSRYFRSRELGDIQHRMQALSRVQNFISTVAPALVIDIVFSLIILTVMTAYDPMLTALVASAIAVWMAWRSATLGWRMRLTSDIASAEARTQSHLLESLRAIVSIKSCGGEAARSGEWCDRLADTINARFRLGNLHVLDGAIRHLLLQGVRILVIYLLAKAALAGEMTVGRISAFAAWLGMFSARAASIVDHLIEMRLLRVPIDRLADIVFGEPERNGGQTTSVLPIECRRVSFAYGSGEPPVLRNCECEIRQGEFVAIAGPSGCGKSTLLQLLCGAEIPTSGDLRIGRVRSTQWDESLLREHIASVEQDDCLLRGSVARNIALFEEQIDDERVRRAAAFACVASDIEALPMSYETLIGDLGSSLSNGQVQRVLLARAWYRNTELLLLDEVTSGLDPELERRVTENIAGLENTRVAVTHSDRMLAAADRVLWLHEGRLLSSPPALNA